MKKTPGSGMIEPRQRQALLEANLSETPSKNGAAKCVQDYLNGRCPENFFRSFLLVLAKKGISASQLSQMIAGIKKLEKPLAGTPGNLLDVCGTGGDGLGSFNISTVSAFVAAGAGGRVAKHGNRAVTSKCGSSDLMEALGVKLDAPQPLMKSALRSAGIGYFHAPFYHPALARVQALRREIGIRTFFNDAGPLLNPCRLSAQMIGVSGAGQLDFYEELLAKQKIRRALILRSLDGFDEATPSAPTEIAEIVNGQRKRWMLRPSKYGFNRASAAAYKGGGASVNRQIALGILEGRIHGPKRDVVLLNASLALYTAGVAASVAEGVVRSRASLDSGAARKALAKLVWISNS